MLCIDRIYTAAQNDDGRVGQVERGHRTRGVEADSMGQAMGKSKLLASAADAATS